MTSIKEEFDQLTSSSRFKRKQSSSVQAVKRKSPQRSTSSSFIGKSNPTTSFIGKSNPTSFYNPNHRVDLINTKTCQLLQKRNDLETIIQDLCFQDRIQFVKPIDLGNNKLNICEFSDCYERIQCLEYWFQTKNIVSVASLTIPLHKHLIYILNKDPIILIDLSLDKLDYYFEEIRKNPSHEKSSHLIFVVDDDLYNFSFFQLRKKCTILKQISSSYISDTTHRKVVRLIKKYFNVNHFSDRNYMKIVNNCKVMKNNYSVSKSISSNVLKEAQQCINTKKPPGLSTLNFSETILPSIVHNNVKFYDYLTTLPYYSQESQYISECILTHNLISTQQLNDGYFNYLRIRKTESIFKDPI